MKTSSLRAWALASTTAVALLAGTAGAQRPERSGAEVVETVCASCHLTGAQGAPKIGDKRAWSARASQGLTALTGHALTGIRNMPAHGGSPGLSDIEVERAITHMVNRSGGQWIEPLGQATPAVLRTSEQIAQGQCAKCHQDGVQGAPRIGDRVAWTPRLAKGLDTLVKSAVHGRGHMPARGGAPELSDVEIQGAILYMFNYGMPPPPPPLAAAAAPNPYHRVLDGADVYLGVVRADRLAGRSAQGNVPRGKDVYHVNISLFDGKTGLPITNARVSARVADAINGETRTLDLESANNTVSYGGYFRMTGLSPYSIVAQIQRPGIASVSEARFEYRLR
jgi:cytochrome c5